jgi:hypothetical protein
LNDGRVLTLRGSAIGDKRWITVEANKDAALSAKTHGVAYALDSFRYDAIFRPLEQLLQPRPSAVDHAPRGRAANRPSRPQPP